MGFSITLSSKSNLKSIAFRGVMLFFFGLVLNFQARNFYDIGNLRIPGILQRLAITYSIVSLFHMYATLTVQVIIMFCFMVIYGCFTYFYQVPDCVRGDTSENCFFGGYLDRLVFTANHIIAPSDPEGILSTLTATYSVFYGYLNGLIMKNINNHIYEGEEMRKFKVFFFMTICALLNLFVAYIFIECFEIPLNKKIYSLSFTFYVSGLGALILAFFQGVCDIMPQELKTVNKLLQPLIWLGSNPLAVFVCMQIGDILMMNNILIDDVTLWDYIYANLFNSWITHVQLASLVLGLSVLIFWTVFAYVLFKKQIFIKL